LCNTPTSTKKKVDSFEKNFILFKFDSYLAKEQNNWKVNTSKIYNSIED